jgi:hypothetical protein
VLAVTLVLAWTGAIGSLLYDGDEPVSSPARVGSPLDSTRVIDRNVKYLVERTGSQAGQYGALLRSLSERERALGPLELGTRSLLRNVDGLGLGASRVLRASRGISAELRAVQQRAAGASGSLAAVASQSSGAAGQLGAMRAATAALSSSVSAIDGAAGRLARRRLPQARSTTQRLNRLLPARVPAARRVP